MNNKNIYCRESRLRNGSCNNISTKTANVSKKNSNKKRKFPEKEGSNIKHNNTDLMFQNNEYEEMNDEIEIDNNGDPNDIVLEYFDDQHHEEIKIETNEGELQNDEINELAYDDTMLMIILITLQNIGMKMNAINRMKMEMKKQMKTI